MWIGVKCWHISKKLPNPLGIFGYETWTVTYGNNIFNLCMLGSQGSSDSMVIKLQARRLRTDGSILNRGKKFFSLCNSMDCFWDPCTPICSGYWRLYPWRMKLTTQLPLVPTLRMSGAVPLLQHACMAWAGMTVLAHTSQRLYQESRVFSYVKHLSTYITS